MTFRKIPVDSQRKDWPRLVANKSNELDNRVAEREKLTRAKMRFFYG